MTDIKNVSHSDFDNALLKAEEFTILECYCCSTGMLQIMEPVFVKLKEHNLFFSHMRLNIQDNPFVVETFYVIRVPSYLFFYHRKLIDRLEGLVSFDLLHLRIEQHLLGIKLGIYDRGVI